MGSSESKHALLHESMLQLQQSPSSFSSTLQSFLNATQAESLLNTPISIENLNTLCNLLKMRGDIAMSEGGGVVGGNLDVQQGGGINSQNDLTSSGGGSSGGGSSSSNNAFHISVNDEKLIFQSILKVLESRQLYSLLYENFSLDLLLQEIDNSDHNLYEGLVIVWKIVTFNADVHLFHQSVVARCANQYHSLDASSSSSSREQHHHLDDLDSSIDHRENFLYVPFSDNSFNHTFRPVELSPQEKESESDNKYLFAKLEGFEFLISIIQRIKSNFSLQFTDPSSGGDPSALGGVSGDGSSFYSANQFTTEEAVYFIIGRIFNSYIVDNAETTSLQILEKLMEVVMRNFETIIELCHHPMQIIRILYSNFILTFLQLSKQKSILQTKFIQSGELLWQLLFCVSQNNEHDSFLERQQKQLSIEFISMFCEGNTTNISCIQQLLPAPVFEWAFERSVSTSGSNPSASGHNSTNLSPQLQMQQPNWSRMFHNMGKNYKTPSLIWNFKTRAELREKIQMEIDSILSLRRKQLEQPWVPTDFFIEYESLEKHLKVGNYYLTELMKVMKQNVSGRRGKGKHSSDDDNFTLHDPVKFVDQLYDASVIESHPINKKLIFTAMRTVISQYLTKFHDFRHIPYLVWLLHRERCDEVWQEELLLLIKKLFSHKSNIRNFIRLQGVHIAMEHLAPEQSNASPPQPKRHDEPSPIEYESDSSALTTNATSRDVSRPVSPLQNCGLSNHHLLIIHILSIAEAVCAYPRSRNMLSSVPYLQYIVQTLLFVERNVTNQTVLLLGNILENNRPLQTSIYKTGIFSFLMLHMSDHGCSQLISMFLRDYHQMQAHDNSRISSYLEYYLPRPLILMLSKDKGAELFAEAMNTESNLDPYLIWSREHREKMTLHVREELASFLTEWKGNPKLLYDYKEPTKINYDDLERELCIENIYVRRFVESPQVDIDDLESFLKGLLKTMHTETNPQHLQLILGAQIVLFKKVLQSNEDAPHFANANPTFAKYPGFPILFDILQEVGIPEDLDTLIAITTLMTTILEQPAEISQYNKASFILNQGISKFMRLLQKATSNVMGKGSKSSMMAVFHSSEIHSEPMAELFSNIVRIFTVLSGSDAAHRISKIPNFFTTIASLMLCEMPQLSHYAVKCLREFLSQTTYTQEIVMKGAFFYLLTLLLRDLQVEPAQGTHSATHIEIVISLKILASDELGASILSALLTPNLLQELVRLSSEEFLTLVQSNVESSFLFWNTSMRQQLLELCESQIDDILRGQKNENIDLEQVYAMRFSALADEIIINNVYLRTMNRKREYDDIDIDKLVEFLFESIQVDAQKLISLIRVNKGDLSQAEEYHGETTHTLLDGFSTKIRAIRLLIESEKGKNVIYFLLSCVSQEHSTRLDSLVHLLTIVRSQKHLSMFASDSTLLDLLHIYRELLKTPGLSSRLGRLVMYPVQHILLDENTSKSVLRECLQMLKILFSVEDLEAESIRSGIVLCILHHFISSKDEGLRHDSAQILGLLASSECMEVLSILQGLLMSKFKRYILSAHDSPDLLLFYFDEEHSTPEIVWNNALRGDLRDYVTSHMNKMREHFTETLSKNVPQIASYNWNGDLTDYDRSHLRQEIQIGGIFVKSFIDNPNYKLPKQEAFLNSLFKALQSQYTVAAQQSELDSDLISHVELIWEAIHHLFNTNLIRLQQSSVKYIGFILYHFEHRLFRASKKANHFVLKSLLTLSRAEIVTQHFAEQATSLMILLHLLFEKTATPDERLLTLSILSQLVERSSLIVKCLNQAGGLLYITHLLLHTQHAEEVQRACVDLLMELAGDSEHGNDISRTICRLTTSKFLLKLECSSNDFTEFFFDSHSTQNREWNEEARRKLMMYLEKRVQALDGSEWDGESRRIDAQNDLDDLDIEVYGSAT
mmetsp:Transcript_6805/g.25418  ORF Transcript_6805/g.25418 Transcript_6805/m.25418 type:complete len:1908 (-) Transcript_6805:57-5780(-)